MNILDFIPVSAFEVMGVIAGLSACFVVSVQVRKEYLSSSPSSLSSVFLFGWLLIYTFWCLYGIRFEAVALWLTNAIAIVLQTLLCIVVIRKKLSAAQLRAK